MYILSNKKVISLQHIPKSLRFCQYRLVPLPLCFPVLELCLLVANIFFRKGFTQPIFMWQPEFSWIAIWATWALPDAATSGWEIVRALPPLSVEQTRQGAEPTPVTVGMC